MKGTNLAKWIVNRDANKSKKDPKQENQDVTEVKVEGFPNVGLVNQGNFKEIEGRRGET
ncbi:hypothetical protein OLK001_24360 [Synechocystis sp. LKSZ1]